MPRAAIGTVALVCFAALLASTASAAPARPARSVTALSALEGGVLADINRYRLDNGLAPLRPSVPLAAAAHAHSQSMATRGYFSHDSANGLPFWRRIRRYYALRSGYWSVGENLLWASPNLDAASALKMWVDSPPHRENLLNPHWHEIGIGAVHVDSAPGSYGGAPVTVVTADFGVRR